MTAKKKHSPPHRPSPPHLSALPGSDRTSDITVPSANAGRLLNDLQGLVCSLTSLKVDEADQRGQLHEIYIRLQKRKRGDVPPVPLFQSRRLQPVLVSLVDGVLASHGESHMAAAGFSSSCHVLLHSATVMACMINTLIDTLHGMSTLRDSGLNLLKDMLHTELHIKIMHAAWTMLSSDVEGKTSSLPAIEVRLIIM